MFVMLFFKLDSKSQASSAKEGSLAGGHARGEERTTLTGTEIRCVSHQFDIVRRRYTVLIVPCSLQAYGKPGVSIGMYEARSS
jgi:hypothetical protein